MLVNIVVEYSQQIMKLARLFQYKLEENLWISYRERKNFALDCWSSITTYDNWKYTVKFVSRFFVKKKVYAVKEKEIRNFAREYVRTYKITVTAHSTIARHLQNLRGFFFSLQDYGLEKTLLIKALSKFFGCDEWAMPAKKYVFINDGIIKIKAETYWQLNTTSVTVIELLKITILIALQTGMRPQEIQDLKWSNLVTDGKYKAFRINNS